MVKFFTSFLYRKFMRPKTIRVHAATWNVNSKPPPKALLTQLFMYTADIYVIGLQEMGSHEWAAVLDQCFPSEDVVRIKVRKLQSMMIIAYVQRNLLDYITRIESEATKTGLGGMWGNKGAVSIRFEIYGVNVIFVNSHLAAHAENLANRIQDVTDIIDSQKFRDEEVNCILDHDYVFWMGDMNFRLDLSYESALHYIQKNDIQALLGHDQLKGAMMDGLIFQDFQEPTIRFKPTYKFDIGTQIYDTSQKKRVPSYTDRILSFHHTVTYGKKDHLHVEFSGYRSHPSFIESDHRPVSCTMDILGLSRPSANPVVFKVNKTVSRKVPLSVSYKSHHMELTTSDWIGVYRADFTHLINDFLAFQYAAIKYQLYPFSGHIQMAPATFANMVKGASYVLCYFSKKYSLCGMSKPFKVKD